MTPIAAIKIENEVPWAVSVKNTFVHIVETVSDVVGKGPRRQGTSLPPSLRIGRGSSLAEGRLAASSAAARRKLRVRTASTVSSDAENSTEADGSTEDDVSVGPWSAKRAATDSFEHELSTGGRSGAATPMGSEPLSPEFVPQLAPACPCLAPGPRLNPKARAWTPGEAPAPPAPVMQRPRMTDFASQLAYIVAAASAALSACPFVASAEAFEAPSGWTVLARLHPQHAHLRDQALGCAREAIRQGAAAAVQTHLLGCHGTPFKVTPVGFAALLAAVPDENTACWGLLERGFCRFGPRCHWQHPTLQASVDVVIGPPAQS